MKILELLFAEEKPTAREWLIVFTMANEAGAHCYSAIVTSLFEPTLQTLTELARHYPEMLQNKMKLIQ